MKIITLLVIVLTTSLTRLSSQNYEEVSLSAFGVYQKIKIDVNTETKFKIQAAVKAEILDEAAWAGLVAVVMEKGESYGFYDNMGDRPIKSNEWGIYEVEGILNEKSDTLHFGVQGFYTGRFLYDDVTLFIEDGDGQYNKLEIFNSGFENPMKDNILPNWDQYTIDEKTQKPKDIVVSTTSDSYSGNLALSFDCSKVKPPITIGKYDGATPQMATLITMLEDLRERVFSAVEGLDLRQTDHLLDDKANRIGALIKHLVAAEKYYQVFTFEGRSFNEEEAANWQMALDLGNEAREVIKGETIDHYLKMYSDTREETIRLLKEKDDEWLKEEPMSNYNNHYMWFHVMEHQSSHLGQILFLKKRLPEKEEFKN